MNIERFEVPGLAQYAYMVSDRGEAAVIDPMRDVEPYIRAAAAQGLRITTVLETHIHADYASGAKALVEASAAELYLSAYDAGERFDSTLPHRALHHGDTVTIGNARLQVLYTPGHTPEHIAFLLFETDRSAEIPVAMFSGDFLFVGSLGRPDLLGDEAKLGLAQELYTSVSQRIASLPDGLIIYPGHGAGSLCGAGLSDRPESTLGYERAVNPYFQMSEQQFIDSILGAAPEMPAYYPLMKALNSEGAAAISSLPVPKSLSPKQFAATMDGATILDLRTPEAFGGAHIPGAINIGLGGNISMWAGWLLPPDASILLVGAEADYAAARTALARVGLDNVSGTLRGGMAAWIAEGRDFARIDQRSVEEAETLLAAGEVAILDVRTPTEVSHGTLPGAKTISLGDLSGRVNELDRNQPLLAVCGSGYRSSIASSLLARAGFSQVSSLHGGMSAWRARNAAPTHSVCSI